MKWQGLVVCKTFIYQKQIILSKSSFCQYRVSIYLAKLVLLKRVCAV